MKTCFFSFKKMKSFALGCFIFLTSCRLCSPTMTAPAFEQIPIGSSILEVEAQVGSPYRVTTPKAGVQHYYYIERIQTTPNSISQNTYVLTVVDGQVVDKQSLNESSPFNFQIR